VINFIRGEKQKTTKDCYTAKRLSRTSFCRHSAYLPVGRQALSDFPDPVANERLHTVANGGIEHFGGPSSRLNELLDLIGPNQQFMEWDTPPIP
jgi:hypothetical protein